MSRRTSFNVLMFVIGASISAGLVQAAETEKKTEQGASAMPAPPWPPGDELGMANQLGSQTWRRCASYMTMPKAKVYELSYLRSNTMPTSPFSTPFVVTPNPTKGIPGTVHAFNGEHYEAGAEPGQQGTQIDPLGHFAFLKEPWDGKPPFPSSGATYYGGFTQAQVKPTDDSPLMHLGVEKIPPIITSAVLLDAKAAVGGGKPMEAGQIVTAKDVIAMLKKQGLAQRGIQPGDVVYIRTGWGDNWKDPDTEKFYYTKAPGLGLDAAKYLAERRIVAIGLDAQFIDAAAEGMIRGKAPPAPGSPPGQAFPIHHFMLTQAGIHNLENVKLNELADEHVWLSCTIVLPLRERGGAGSAIRPVAIGVPRM